MKKTTSNLSKILPIAIVVLILCAISALLVFRGGNTSDHPTVESCVSDDCLQVEDLEYPVSSLPQEQIDALNSAIDDEYKARATYAKVIESLGEVRPFIMIVRAEESHIASLKALFDKYGLVVPSDPYTNVVAKPTLAENCEVGVNAEIANVALYRDSLLPVATDYPDITQVFTELMNASNDRHLPAFQKCAS